MGEGDGRWEEGRRTRWMGDGYTVNAEQYNSVIHALKIQKNLPFAHVSKKKKEKKKEKRTERENEIKREPGRRQEGEAESEGREKRGGKLAQTRAYATLSAQYVRDFKKFPD